MSQSNNRLKICAEDTICQSTDPVAANMDGEVALMSISSGKYYCLNETSSRIWQLIEQPRHVNEVCQVLLEEYTGIEPLELEAVLLEHVAQLVEENLVQVKHAAAA